MSGLRRGEGRKPGARFDQWQGCKQWAGDARKELKLLPYRIEYSPDAEEHLRVLTARQQRIVLDAVDRLLAREPIVETRNRKPMRPNPVAPWELRVGNLRVYYDVEEGSSYVVTILAVGVKQRNRVRIGREMIEL